MKLFCICLGGAIGTAARYLVTLWLADRYGRDFPYGTLAVNLVGSFLIGLILYVATNTDRVPELARLTLTTGVMGGFTTYSSFNYETLEMLRRGDARLAVVNVLATGVGCLVAGVLGLGAGALVSR